MRYTWPIATLTLFTEWIFFYNQIAFVCNAYECNDNKNLLQKMTP